MQVKSDRISKGEALQMPNSDICLCQELVSYAPAYTWMSCKRINPLELL